MKTFSEQQQASLLPHWVEKLEGRYAVDPDGCRRWSGRLDKWGYANITALRRTTGAHRVSWISARGVIPEGLTIDHLCRTRSCVNPDHMEVVTNAENIKRRTRDNPGGTGRPRIPIDKRAGCRRHGKGDGKFATQKAGYVFWDCRICGREGLARFHSRRRSS